MKEREAREMLKELFERHSIPAIPVKFHSTPMVTKGEYITELRDAGLGHLAAAVTVITRGEFKVNPVTRERWIEFHGLPSPTDVRHEFRHYLDLLGLEYIRKSPTPRKEAEAGEYAEEFRRQAASFGALSKILEADNPTSKQLIDAAVAKGLAEICEALATLEEVEG